MRLSFYSVVAVLIAFAMGYGVRPKQAAAPPASNLADVATQGAYRDGLYLGRLHRKQGLAASHPTPGRWSREDDRRLFLQGYDEGYSASKD